MIRAFTKNIGWKVLSLGLACLLWVALVRDPELATNPSVPVLYRGMPEALELSGDLVNRVELELRGPSSQLTQEDLAKVAVILDLGNVDRPGDRTYTIQASNVTVPPGVIFSRATPSQIRLHFESRVSRQVPVRFRISNPPPSGYRIVRQVVAPESLAVVGPQSNVEQISFVDTDSIDLSTVFGTATFEVNTFVADAQVRFEDPPRVVVTVTVEKTDAE